MSALMQLGNELTTHLAALPMEGEGILDVVDQKNTQVQVLTRAIAVTIAILFVIWQGISSRGAMGRIIVAGVGAAIFLWFAFNITSVRDRVDNEINSAPAPASVTTVIDDLAPPAGALI